ncbi:hypothetical protein BMS3Abin03_02738 [bacterium BMS3Abin03]|nr:hypothetical protein BMS3Abin03_02738 [bacterium BMS3Abin03]
MRNKILICAASVYMILFIACSSSRSNSVDTSIEIKSHSVNCWLNLMPGSHGKFFMNGELEIINTGKNDIKRIDLSSITIYSNKEVVYNFNPITETKFLNDDLSLDAGEEKFFRFSTDGGLKLDERLMGNNIIDMKIEIMFDTNKIIYEIDSVTVERAY